MKNHIIYSITGYKGLENEVLRLRNKNRPDDRTKTYMDWRYLGQKAQNKSFICWAIDSYGMRVGMVGLVFRPYWINNKRYYFAVIGDISLNSELRGQGIAKKMFEFMNNFIKQENCPVAFVIPNFSAQKSLLSAGWKIKEKIFTYVFPIDPADKLYTWIKSKAISKSLGFFFRYFISIKVFFYLSNEYSANYVNKFDSSFDDLWSSVLKKNLIIRERDQKMLKWRYQSHPYDKFHILKFFKKNDFIGYIVYSNKDINNCNIYEMMVLKTSLLKPIIALFLSNLLKNKENKTVRININEKHPYAKSLNDFGFIERKNENSVQIFMPQDNLIEKTIKWFVTAGDKDV